LLHCGVEEVMVLEKVETVKELGPIGGYILAGEREALKIEGFDYGNSPVEFIKNADQLRKKSVILTTTNGAKAIQKANKHGDVIALSLLNLNSVVDFVIKKEYKDIGIICSGTDENVSLEDCFAAGIFVKKFISEYSEQVEINDGAKIALKLASAKKNEIKNSTHATRLKKLGFKEDLDFCFEINMFDIVPFAKKGSLVFKKAYLTEL
jgi:2-phosphosulfolactate phosphatase